MTVAAGRFVAWSKLNNAPWGDLFSAIIGEPTTRRGRLMAKKAAGAKKRQRAMSDEHKAALAEGREQGRVVRRYLEALESSRPKRGRRRTPETITK